MPKPLRVDPSILHAAAEAIAGHANDFAAIHHATHQQPAQVTLGSGLASAALPDMLGAWEADGTGFGKHFTSHARGHRAAANAYTRTDGDGASRIGDAGSAL